MGPVQSILKIPGGLPPNPQPDGLGYNPRCMRRDISLQASNATNDFEVSSLIKNHNDIASFQNVFQGLFEQGKHSSVQTACETYTDFCTKIPGLLGVHGGGHFTIGGDAGSDFYNSPADPAFFPHHATVDRVWW
jgi:tyrosinase